MLSRTARSASFEHHQIIGLDTSGPTTGTTPCGALHEPLLTAGDINGDGDDDLLLVSSDALQIVWVQVSDGSIAIRCLLTPEGALSGGDALAVTPHRHLEILDAVAGDFDADGSLDVVLAGNHLTSEHPGAFLWLLHQEEGPRLRPTPDPLFLEESFPLATPLAPAPCLLEMKQSGAPGPALLALLLADTTNYHALPISISTDGLHADRQQAWAIPGFAPTAVPALGDYDGDGQQDLILSTRAGLTGHLSSEGVFSFPLDTESVLHAQWIAALPGLGDQPDRLLLLGPSPEQKGGGFPHRVFLLRDGFWRR